MSECAMLVEARGRGFTAWVRGFEKGLRRGFWFCSAAGLAVIAGTGVVTMKGVNAVVTHVQVKHQSPPPGFAVPGGLQVGSPAGLSYIEKLICAYHTRSCFANACRMQNSAVQTRKD